MGRWGVEQRWVDNAIDQIDASGADGPVYLMGWSAGGRLAFAVASELRRRRREVAWVGIMDVQGEWPGRLSRLGVYLQLRRQDRSPSYRSALRRQVWLRCFYAVAAVASVPLRPLSGSSLLDRWSARSWARLVDPSLREVFQLLFAFRFRPIDVPLAVFATEIRATKTGDELLYWGPFAHNGLRSYVVAGDHFDMFAPEHIVDLAEAIGTSINDAAWDRERRSEVVSTTHRAVEVPDVARVPA
jgi:thioesterase domain-containing protein